jgi:hypothetical protein
MIFMAKGDRVAMFEDRRDASDGECTGWRSQNPVSTRSKLGPLLLTDPNARHGLGCDLVATSRESSAALDRLVQSPGNSLGAPVAWTRLDTYV